MERSGWEVFMEALATGDSGQAIMNQEARGQQDFVRSEALPKECIGCTREQLEEMGIEFGEEIDDLFIEARLPEGWEKQPTEHSMHSEIVDERERVRATVFYKAAFYDRKAHMGIRGRFYYHTQPVNGYKHGGEHRAEPWHCVVKDCGKVVWSSEPITPSEERPWYSLSKLLDSQGVSWLDAHYPNWRDPLAYWNEESEGRQ